MIVLRMRDLASVLYLLMAGCITASAHAEPAVVNGSFEEIQPNGKPVGWEINTANLYVETGPGGNKVLRFERKQPSHGMWATQAIALDPSWQSLKIESRIKAQGIELGDKGHQTPRVQFAWQDDSGKTLGYPSALRVTQDTDWVTVSSVLPVDKKATKLLLSPGNFGLAGDVWFDDIVVTPNPPLEATAITSGLPEGTFEPIPGDTTRGWKLGGPLSIANETGNHFLRLHLPQQSTARVDRRFRLDPSWTMVSVSVKLRAKNLQVGDNSWETGRLQYTFQDASGAQVGSWPSVPQLKQDSGWVTQTKTAEVPEGAVFILITPAMFNASGTLDVDDIRIEGTGADEVPVGVELHWGKEPVVTLSPTASEIVLNGVWKFQPARDAKTEPSPRSWGFINVPGTWTRSWSFPSMVANGRGGAWSGFGDGREAMLGWYERPMHIPDAWKDRRVTVNLDRVSTDAEIYINGIDCGSVRWPSGTVDITKAVRFGEENTLRVLVFATADEGEFEVLMGTEEGHNFTQKRRLATRGLISDVVLSSQAKGPEIQSVGISTSVRQQAMNVTFRTDEGVSPGAWSIKLRVLELDGTLVKQWADNLRPQRDAIGRWSVTVPWEDAQLWDFEDPHLYRLEMELEHQGQKAIYAERFGFREFWIEGRDFFLNGNLVRLRPQSHGHYYPGIHEFMDAEIEGYLDSGFNVKQMWPNEILERGRLDFQKHYATIADEKGLGVIAIMPSVVRLVDTWNQSGVQQQWQATVVDQLAQLGNHPSILMWNTSANRFGHGDDQNPIRIGNRANQPTDPNWQRGAKVANDAVRQLRQIDPTRPVMIHHGSATGEVYATNNYLNLIPLQEREDWLSHWAEHGDMPYLAVEFGAPLDATFLRGRKGGHNAGISEFLLTEHAATYLGPQSYAIETDSYRSDVLERNNNPLTKPDWHAAKTINDEPAAQAIIELFVRNTWRSWRTYGISGGMIPWSNAGGLVNDWSGGYHENYEQVPKPPFVPGRRGAHFWKDHLPASAARYYQPEANTFLPSWKTLISHNNRTLAWIAGKPGDFSEKDHLFRSGETIQKQLVIINDSLRTQPFNISWSTQWGTGSKTLDQSNGTLRPGEIRKLPIEFSAPATATKIDGRIMLQAKIGDASHTDRFDMRALPQSDAIQIENTIYLWDPDEITARYFASLGIATQPFTTDWASLSSNDLLVIGEKALTDQPGIPTELNDFVTNGGRVMLMAQTPDWWQVNTGFRIAHHVSRRFWPTSGSADHPIVTGLDGKDFRDWRGSGAIAPKTANLELDKSLRQAPLHGWHWNNAGSVAGVALEKPHHAGWTPILEGEFGLAYSPLMELQHGRGLLLINTLDLAYRDEHSPIGDLIVKRSLAYLDGYTPAPLKLKEPQPILFTGDEIDADWLKQIGLTVEHRQVPNSPDQLWILGPAAGVTYDQIARHARAGGRVLVLQAGESLLPQGATLQTAMYGARVDPPTWSIMRGVSVGDLHTRFDVELNLLNGQSRGLRLGADGLLGYQRVGSGEIVYLQAHPRSLAVESTPYLRFTSWRFTRLTTQLLANLGATFDRDLELLSPVDRTYEPIGLAGTWRFETERLVPGAADLNSPTQDEGNLGHRQGFQRVGFDDSAWRTAKMPYPLEQIDKAFDGKDGAFWLRRTFMVPEAWAGQSITLHLGRLDDFDHTYLNGRLIGATQGPKRQAWNINRVYTVPGKQVKAGENTIAIRIFDHFGGGGMMERDPEAIRVSLTDPPTLPSPYVPGFRHDRADGDDPFRYYRW